MSTERVEVMEGKASRPSIVNVNLVTANQEYKHKLPQGCQRFRVQMRDATDFRMAVEQEKVGTANPNPPYFTVKASTTFEERNLDIQEDTWLYFACGGSSKVVEIWQWT